MKEIFNKITFTSITMSIILMIIGFILVVYPGMSLNVFGILAGIYLIVEGIHLIFLDITSRSILIPVDGIIPGVLSIIFGCIVLSMPEVVSSFITIIIGTWIIVTSINSMRLAISLANVKGQGYILLIILSVLEIILGILVLLNPNITSLSVITFIGMMLIIYSTINIIEMIMFKKDVKDIEKIIKK